MVFPIFSSLEPQQHPQTTFQNPIFTNPLDGLYCEEEDFGEGLLFGDEDGKKCEENLKKASTLVENDFSWENDELVRLLSKEKEAHLGYNDDNNNNHLDQPDGLILMVARKEAVEWILKVVAHYGFSALTGVLAVNYYDRFISASLCFHKDKPWMSQLVAVACLSIAAKMEEIQVPLLLDLQVENAKYVFEAKTIMRMELLVLSALKWKTSPVTPISFLDHIARRFGLIVNLHWEFLKRCEHILLSTIVDSGLMRYLPSVIATATMMFVINEIDPVDAMDYHNQLIDVLKIRKEKVDECYQIITAHMVYHHQGQYESRKRKHLSVPCSPSGVVDAYFSCDSSNDSWSVTSSVSSSPEPLFKRSRAPDQPMRLAPFSSISVTNGSKFR